MRRFKDIKTGLEEGLKKDIAQLAAQFPKGTKVKINKTGAKGTVLSNGKDFLVVGVGNDTMNVNPKDLVKEETDLEEGKLVKNMRVAHIHNSKKGTVVKGGDKAGGRVEVEWDDGDTQVVAGKYLKSIKEETDLEEGKMSEFHMYVTDGKSAEWIAKKMKLDLKTVKELMKDMQEAVDEPASPDEAGMALDQAKFIAYVAEEIMEYIQGNKDFPEWMQNKLSGFHEKAKDMHAVLSGKYDETSESTAAYAASLDKIANDKKLKGITPKDREMLVKLAALMAKEKK